MKIAVLTSGGVDSSFALRLLRDQGHELTAFYLKIWLEDEFKDLSQCPWEEDLKYVESLCDKLQISLEVVPMQQKYWELVIEYVVRESRAGRTPNPDIFCNHFIKFGAFLDTIDPSYEKVATGHYARVIEKEGVFHLLTSPDLVKDQTYFLSHLTQEQLSKALFPIGHLSKSEVRRLSEQYQIPSAHRKDSQGICFLGKVPYREFLRRHLGDKKGDFVELSSGRILGQHEGFWFYTIGQRSGLGLSGGPWFVVQKDVEKNIIYLANGYQPEDVLSDEFQITGLHSFANDLRFKVNDLDLYVKIRHGAAMHPCTLEIHDDRGIVHLSEKAHGIAPGQFAVFYSAVESGGFECLGCGMIS